MLDQFLLFSSDKQNESQKVQLFWKRRCNRVANFNNKTVMQAPPNCGVFHPRVHSGKR